MVQGLKNACLAGRNEWPKNVVTKAYNYLSKWEGDGTVLGAKPRDYEGVTFEIDGETAKSSGPQPWHAKMTCRDCNKKGHIASLCESSEVANSNVQDGELHEDATQQLLDSLQKETGTDYEADIFVCETDENRSASFRLHDGMNGIWIPKRRRILFDSQSTADALLQSKQAPKMTEASRSSTPKKLKRAPKMMGASSIETRIISKREPKTTKVSSISNPKISKRAKKPEASSI